MSLSNQKRIFGISVFSDSMGKVELQIQRLDNKKLHIFPFSCISLIASQLTVLTYSHPRFLCNKVINLIENSPSKNIPIAFCTGFKLDIYEGDNKILFNQFEPTFNSNPLLMNDDLLQTDLENLLINYISFIYYKSDINERLNLYFFLLMTILYYQQGIIPIIREINLLDLSQKARLAKTQVDFCSSVYDKWNNTNFTLDRNEIIQNKLVVAKEFKAYLA